MNYIIGMDGGGTKTHCVIADLNGKILYECTGGASNFLLKGTDKVCNTLFDLVKECKENLAINYNDISIILIGTTGAGRRSDAERLEKAFNELLQSKNIPFNKFKVESDARIALEGAFSGKPGSILIAGTGSIMFGKDANGNIHRVGGFGRYIGDEGSGYTIGKKGLTAVSKEFDGRGTSTLISKLAAEKFNITSQEILITEIYKNNFDIASAAPVVLEAAENSDPAAIKIIDEESDELIMHISAMARKLNEPVLNIAFIGSIISGNNIYSRMFKEKINTRLTNVVIKTPDHPPAVGAVLIAKELLKEK